MASPDDDLLRRLKSRLSAVPCNCCGGGCNSRRYDPAVLCAIARDEDTELLREVQARIAQMAEELEDWKAGRMADASGHMFRCAKVNGVWSCRDGCAVRRAEQAEAQLRDTLAHLRQGRR